MTREEKAKAYDEAVERAKALYNSVFVNNDVLEQIFPELKESESEDELYDFKVFATKQAKEHHISFVHDFEWNNFCTELLSYFAEQKPSEWSEEDKETIDLTIAVLKENLPNVYFKTNPANTLNMGAINTDQLINRLKSLSPQSKQEWSEDYREEDIQTRFAFYTYKDDPSTLYLSNVFVEEASRNHHFGTRILSAAEKVAETIGATTISLKVRQDSPANTWYRKNGYGYVAFEDGYDWLEKNLEYMKSKPQVEQGQKPLEYLPKEKINSIMSKLTNLSFSKLIPFNSEEYKKIDEITTDVCDLLDYPIEKKQEQKPVDEQFPPLEGLDAIKAKYYDNGFKNGFDEGVESVKPLEWSEDDEEMIEGIIGDLCALKDWIIKYDTNWLANPVLKNIDKRIAWLKSLKDRGNFPKSNTNSPSEWSEEDENALNYFHELISFVYDCFQNGNSRPERLRV